jgi:hypothetical protein
MWTEPQNKGKKMLTATWKPEYTARAQTIWERFQRLNDLSDRKGKVAAIDPQSERVWVGESGVDVAQQMQAE